MILRLLNLVSIFSILSFCSYPVDMDEKDSYTPLAVGDVSQFIDVADSSTTLISIIGKVLREDGEDTYLATFKYSFIQDSTIVQALDSNYFMISDGFLVITWLEQADDSYNFDEDNPFQEHRLAKSFPQDEDTWSMTGPLNDYDYFLAEKMENFQTFYGNINEPFVYKHYGDDGRFLGGAYYGKKIGYIGGVDREGKIIEKCSYKKVTGKEYGELWPEKEGKGPDYDD